MKGSTFLKRSLALVLTVVMLVSCWVFTAPSASAATAGNYNVVVKFNVENSCGSKYTEDNYITITYKSNNGTGNESTKTWDLDSIVTSGGEKTVSATLGGYPTKVKLNVNNQQASAWKPWDRDGVKVKVHTVTVQNTDVWTGTIELESDVIEHSETKDIGNLPYAASITAISGDSTVYVNTDGTTNNNYSYSHGTVRDQYGVNWYQDASWDTATVSNGVTFSNGTLTVPASSNRASNYTVTLKEKCGNASNTKTVTVSVFKYQVTFYDENGTTVLKQKQDVAYGGNATAPSSPTKAYDSSKHYTFNTWTGDTYQNITSGKQVKTVKASYTGTTHNYDQTSIHVDSGTGKTLKTVATCTDAAVYYNTCSCGAIAPASANKTHTFGSALGHTYPKGDDKWTSYDDPDQHKKVCGRDSSHIIYEDHSFTKAEVKGAALKENANCDIPAVYYYSCAGCGQVEFNDNHTFIDPDGSPLAAHDWGDPVEFSGSQTIYKRNAQDTWGYPTSATGHSVEATYSGESYHVASCRDFSETHKNYTAHTPSANAYYYGSAEDNNVPAAVRSELVEKLKDGYQYAVDLENPESSPGQHFTYCTVDSCHHLAYENHSYTETVVPPTCEENGYTRHQCACGYYYDTDTVPATGHKYDSYTDNGDGTHSATCVNTNERTGEPCGYKLTEACSFTLELVLRDEDGNITNAVEGREATCTVNARCYKSCQYCRSVATADETDETGNATAFEAVGTMLKHKWVQHVVVPEDAQSGQSGFVYFACPNGCGQYQAGVYDNSEEKYKETGTAVNTVEEAKTNAQKTPAPYFNDASSEAAFYGNPYYAQRPASFKKMSDSEMGKQTVRFAGSVKIPEGVKITNTDADDDNNINNIIDFGFVYTQKSFILDENNKPDPDKLVFCEDEFYDSEMKTNYYNKSEAGYRVYKMSLAENNAPSTDISDWEGCTVQTSSTGGEYLTFNLVININAKNWHMEYVGRPYIIYNYNGIDYTVYDSGVSSGEDDEGNIRITYFHRSVNSLAGSIMNFNQYFDRYGTFIDSEGYEMSVEQFITDNYIEQGYDYDTFCQIAQGYIDDKDYVEKHIIAHCNGDADFKNKEAVKKDLFENDGTWINSARAKELLDTEIRDLFGA